MLAVMWCPLLTGACTGEVAPERAHYAPGLAARRLGSADACPPPANPPARRAVIHILERAELARRDAVVELRAEDAVRRDVDRPRVRRLEDASQQVQRAHAPLSVAAARGILDRPPALAKGLQVHRFAPSLSGLWADERALQAAASAQDTVL